MNNLPEDSIILYADSGVVLTKSVEKIVELINKYSIVIVGHGKSAPLRRHLKREAFGTFSENLTDEILDSQNIWAFFIGLRNTQKNRDLVNKWLIACQNPDALTDKPFNPHNQFQDFINHQHDQSLLSVIIASEPKENYIIVPRPVIRKQYGVYNFHRHPVRELQSPLFIAAGLPQWISTIVWNNPFMRMLRKITNN